MMTMALARVGRISWWGTARSDADPTQLVAGQTMDVTSAAITASRIPAPAQLMARIRASSAPRRGLKAPSARCRIASRHKAYPGCTPSALSDQKLASAMRNSGRQPNQPARATASRMSPAPKPYSSRILEKRPLNHAVATSGARPRIAAGNRIDAVHASKSFVRLISAKRLPAIARSDFCFGLDASSSASPSRGSRIGPAGRSSRRSSSALGGEASGAGMASDENFPTASVA